MSAVQTEITWFFNEYVMVRMYFSIFILLDLALQIFGLCMCECVQPEKTETIIRTLIRKYQKNEL